MTPPAAAAAPAVHPGRRAPGRQRTAPLRPRRISGPARVAPGALPARRPSERDGGLAIGLLGLLDRVSRNRLLDQLIRGRTSIALVAFALIGIVTLQLGLLKLNSSIGRTLERESVLQRENAALSIQNSELTAGERVEARATQLGMSLVPVGAFRFLTARPHIDGTRGAAALRTPVHASSEGSSEAPAGAGAGASASQASVAPEGASEQVGTSASETPSSGESSSAGEAPSAPAGQTAQPAGESSSAPPSATQPSGASSSPPPGATGGGSTESTPAGGIQAGPTG
jgi:cell division protein FtsL